ncbi:MAG: hypothetical protein ABIA76_00295 [Candidatus Diapherotrites archaeon]
MAKKFGEKESSLGERYSQISVSIDDFSDSLGETKLVKKKFPKFVAYAKKIYSMFPVLGTAKRFSDQNRDAIEFMDWELNPREFDALIKATLIISVIIAFLIGTICLLLLGDILSGLFKGNALLIQAICFLPWLAGAFYAFYFVQQYPLSMAKHEQMMSLTYMPDLIGYLVMSMKLVPNLEKAIEFSADHGKGKIAEDFRKLIWDVQIGVHKSLSEGLDKLAYRWGKFSSEFKQALMRVRASVIENTEAKRYALLDKTMSEVLSSVKEKMENYARGLSQPSIMLFYLGVLLPLILIIILPVGSSFSGAPIAHPIVLGFLYIFLIPGGTFLLARSLIYKKPPVHESPKIPDNYPGLPKKGTMIVSGIRMSIPFVLVLVLIFGLAFSFFVSTQGIPPKFIFGEEDPVFILSPDQSAYDVQLKRGLINENDAPDYFSFDPPGEMYRDISKEFAGMRLDEAERLELIKQRLLLEEKIFYMKKGNNVAPNNFVFGLMLTLSALAFVYFYYSNIYRRKAQLEVEQMESEFKDSLYILASRMGENKPLENALKHVKEFLPNYKISIVYERILENITVMSMPLEQAVFDKNFGALKDIPSKMIATSMRLLINSVNLGVNVAARTMIALSIQLQNAEEVSKKLTLLLSDVTEMMSTLSLFIAPVVLGITVSLQKVVVLTLFSIASSGQLEATQSQMDLSALPGGLGGIGEGVSSMFSGSTMNSFIDTSSVSTVATPTEFIFILAIYIIELVAIMTYFTTRVSSENNLLVKINLAKALPVAIIVFIASVIASDLFIGGFAG